MSDPIRRPGFQHHLVDLADADSVLRAITDAGDPIKAIVHLAAYSHTAGAAQQPIETVYKNVMMTKAILQAALHIGSFPTVVIAGSAAEYGDIPLGASPPNESAPLNPRDPYAESKAIGSLLAIGYARQYDFPVPVLRFANVYGPGQSEEKFIPGIIARTLRHKLTSLGGMGKPTRDYLFVDDCCEAIMTAAHGMRFGIFNIGGGLEYSNAAIFGYVLTALENNRAIESSITDYRLLQEGDGGARRIAMDCSKAHHTLPWRATTGIIDGLRLTVERYLQEKHLENRA